MKRLFSAVLLIIVVLPVMYCSKSSSVPDDPAASLKGTVWAGQFHYLHGYTEQQPFSVKLDADSSFTWYQLGPHQSGRWWVKDSIISLRFPQEDVLLEANFKADVWNNFVYPGQKRWLIDKLYRSRMLNADSLRGSIWLGKLRGGISFGLAFLPGTQLKCHIDPAVAHYAVEGAGIQFPIKSGQSFAVIEKDGFSMTGIYLDPPSVYYLWYVNKQ
ncbi:hypothetical protein [Chitinophaga sp. 212800010-3]|uniref:hypothetical protein n=1 Tax=unclassified Chitinophaga TaxID=2619133 RepID=UPI002DE64B2A|nr:hypothetical protein [Chitinophaga sp. 212800010-3]